MTPRRKRRPPPRAPAPDANQRFAAVYSGQQCLGHVLARGRSGFEAFDESRGIFETQAAAANALVGTKRGAA
jgi:hypothetical protein